ncbi:MAG: hypothetical protein GY789_02760 [Hyphomicrobiales bacterium]|nr:hypothetical protein [Hyphomicrobiales bacterium]MCP5001068.1 hypothetical protein [Hyphomicrobiales bacterium]
MIRLFTRIFSSLFAIPAWVLIWMFVFLIPANLSGFFMLDTVSGIWIATLGGGALGVNTVLVLINGGLSRVLAAPHLILWLPLELILVYRAFAADMGPGETWLVLIVLIINGVSLGFDLVDTQRWYRGERAVFGFEGKTARL